MGVRFLIGRSGTDKSEVLLDEIEKELITHPEGSPIIYLVPDQMTFQQEYRLLTRSNVEGSIRAQVFSFSRLAWRVLQETGGGTRKFISSTGIQMMLRKIAEEKKADWKVFQKAVEKQGFIEQLETMITEFKRYCITPEVLQEQIRTMDRFTHKYKGEETLRNKLEDLSFIYEQLTSALKENYVDSEDQLQILADKIPEADFLENATIYLDGFHRFTPQELLVLSALVKKVNRVTIALTLDRPTEHSMSELDLFYQTGQTYQQLIHMFEENGVPVNGVEILNQSQGRFKNKPHFTHLEHYFDQRPSPSFNREVPIVLGQAVHPRAEVEGVAQEILNLVRDEGYRYKDMALFIREPEVYHELIQTVFQDYEIPVFVDEKRTMLNHPLIELIRSGLDIVEGNWRYDAVFRVLKTDFLHKTDERHPLDQEAIDELENYVLEYGIRSRSRWNSEKEWSYQRFRGFEYGSQTDEEKEKQTRINCLRNQVNGGLTRFDERLRGAKTVQEKCQVIFEWLEELNVPQTLEEWRTQYDETGRLEKGREQEQVWDAVINLLDEIVEMLGNEEMSLQLFRATLESGLESLTFSHVPPSIDHAIVASVDRSRLTGVKCSFLLGVNEGVWPMKPPLDGMISEEERELLSEQGMLLADSSKRQLLDDRFYVYLAFTASSDYLWVSYPLSNEEGKSKTPSSLIKRIRDLFPFVSNRLLLQDEALEDQLRLVSTPIKSRAALAAQLAKYLRGYPIDDLWWDVFHWFTSGKDESSKQTQRVLMSLFYENKTTDLKPETSSQLIPKQVKASVSRLETFYRCSYQHFAKYGLGLKERNMHKLDAPDIGQLFHEALRQITEWVLADGRDWQEMSKIDTDRYAKRAVEQLSPILQHQILYSSNRYQYIQKKLEEVIARAAFVLSEQSKRSNFSPVGLELGFGPNQKIPPMMLDLPNGFQIMLRGRIDRVDRALTNEGLFLRIIDYKSSSKGLNLVEVYYGIALQMLAYLNVVLSHSEQWLGTKGLPAGVLYFHVHNPMISEKQLLDDETLEKEIFKKFKMQGLLLEDEQVIKLMDTDLSSGVSKIIPAGLKKNGGFRERDSKTAQEATFNNLQSYIRQLMVQAGLSITSGAVDLNPYQQKQRTACDMCSYRSVCQFDSSLEENDFRVLKEMSDDEILAGISRREEGSE